MYVYICIYVCSSARLSVCNGHADSKKRNLCVEKQCVLIIAARVVVVVARIVRHMKDIANKMSGTWREQFTVIYAN